MALSRKLVKLNSVRRFIAMRGKQILIASSLMTMSAVVYLVFRPPTFSFPKYVAPDSDYKEAAINGVPLHKVLPTKKPTTPSNRIHIDARMLLPYNVSDMRDDMTIVTAYFNLGLFQKGDTNPTNFTPTLYHQWMHVFKRIENPVIAFFDEDKDINFFLHIRQHLPANLTVARKVDRSDMWSFGLVPSIRDIFMREGYPKYHPGTVIPEYSAAMHAKYELMHSMAIENPFRTRYMSWLDIGLFRSIWNKKDPKNFHLYIPPNFNRSKIAYAEVFNRSLNIKPHQIFIVNKEWVCGCMFVGQVDRLTTWTMMYMNATERYMNVGYMNTDQQVVYGLANEGHDTWMQVYQKPKELEAWFHLGYTCKAEGKKRWPQS